LFKPDINPQAALDPIVQRELEKRGHTITQPFNTLGAKSYQNFAITDDTVIFFFGQGVLLAEGRRTTRSLGAAHRARNPAGLSRTQTHDKNPPRRGPQSVRDRLQQPTPGPGHGPEGDPT
jgi:Protein of unknown function (DUF3298)